VRSASRVASQLARLVRRPRRMVGTAATAPEAFDRYWDLVMSYVPRPWAGHVVVLWPAAEQPTCPCDPTLGWGALAKRVDAYVVPGDHDEIVTKEIDRVAEHLRAHL
jgi:thioesterase domain-containing protein